MLGDARQTFWQILMPRMRAKMALRGIRHRYLHLEIEVRAGNPIFSPRAQAWRNAAEIHPKSSAAKEILVGPNAVPAQIQDTVTTQN